MRATERKTATGGGKGTAKRAQPQPEAKVKPIRVPVAINRRWFLDKLAAKDLEQQDLARYLGCSPSSMSQLLHGQRQMKPREVAEIARLFGVAQDEVLVNIGIRPPEVQSGTATLPITGWVDGSLMVHNGVPARGPKRAPLPVHGGRDLRVLRVQSANSEMAMLDGALVYYRPSDVIEPDAIGKQCVVRVVGHAQEAVRYVSRGYQDGRYNLAVAGGSVVKEEDVPLVSAAPVLWTKW